MTKPEYPDARAVEQAIKDAAENQRKLNPSLDKSDLIRQAYFDRFLCRVFSSQSGQWVLKGGTGMLARVPDTRHTMDIDMYNKMTSIDEALDDLKQLLQVDLDDHFSFPFESSRPISQTDNQQYLDGLQATFTVLLGVQSKGKIKVDLVTGFGDEIKFDEMDPLNRLKGLRLRTVPYRIFPLENQIADKVCAIEGTYSGRPSSRSKDLVDLVVIATTQTEIRATDAASAIRQERLRRGHAWTTSLSVPNEISRQYRSAATNVPACSAFVRFEDARDLMTRFVNPLLDQSPKGVWSPSQLTWVD